MIMENTFYVVDYLDGFDHYDNEIAGIFSTLEKANEFISQFPDMKCGEPQEFLVDALCYYTSRRKTGLKPFFVSVDINGFVDRVYEMTKPTLESTQRVGDLLYSYCWANNSKEAIEITNKLRFNMIMANSWRK